MVGLVLASVTALLIVPIVVGLLGVFIPSGLIVAGAFLLLILSFIRYHREKRERRYRYNYRRNW